MHISFSSFVTPVHDSSEWKSVITLALSLGNCSVDLHITLFQPV